VSCENSREFESFYQAHMTRWFQNSISPDCPGPLRNKIRVFQFFPIDDNLATSFYGIN